MVQYIMVICAALFMNIFIVKGRIGMNSKKLTIIALGTVVAAAAIIGAAFVINRDSTPDSSTHIETDESLISAPEMTTTYTEASSTVAVTESTSAWETVPAEAETTEQETEYSTFESSDLTLSVPDAAETVEAMPAETLEQPPVDTTIHTSTATTTTITTTAATPVEEPVEVTTAATTTQSPTPVQTTTAATTISTPATTTITVPSEPKPYSTYGLKIGDFTDQGYEVIGATPDEGIPYIAIDEQWETQQKVVVGYTSWGAPVYNTDMTAWHKAHDAENQQAVEDFLAHGGTIG